MDVVRNVQVSRVRVSWRYSRLVVDLSQDIQIQIHWQKQKQVFEGAIEDGRWRVVGWVLVLGDHSLIERMGREDLRRDLWVLVLFWPDYGGREGLETYIDQRVS